MKLYVLVKVFQGVVDDACLFLSFPDAEEAWKEWTGFKGSYGDHHKAEDFNQNFDESKIFEVRLATLN